MRATRFYSSDNGLKSRRLHPAVNRISHQLEGLFFYPRFTRSRKISPLFQYLREESLHGSLPPSRRLFETLIRVSNGLANHDHANREAKARLVS